MVKSVNWNEVFEKARGRWRALDEVDRMAFAGMGKHGKIAELDDLVVLTELQRLPGGRGFRRVFQLVDENGMVDQVEKGKDFRYR